MRIAIDGIAVSHPQPGGYHTYATNLVKHLALLAGDEYILLTDRPTNLTLPSNWTIEDQPTRWNGLGVVAREQFRLPRRAHAWRAEVLHAPCATGPLRPNVPLVVSIHDTIEFTEPLPPPRQTKRWAMRQYSRIVQSRTAKLASVVITVSEYSRQQIINRFGLLQDRVVAIHLAPSSDYRRILDLPAARALAKSMFGANEHVLALASLATRKNIGRAIKAYSELPAPLRSAHPLVLVCTHAAVRLAVEQTALGAGLTPGQDVIAVGKASNDDLRLLYNTASVFVFPSLEEGFGLPPLEAMACGTPVVAAQTSSLPEVLGEAAHWINPLDTGAIASAIAEVLTLPLLAQRLSERGLRHSQQFSWKKAAEETRAVYYRAGR